MTKVAGLDGCKTGWLIFYKNDNHYSFKLIQTIHSGQSILKDCAKVFIDIPIGLSSYSFERAIETQMRKLLKNRSSTIFTPPCREALACSDYKKANIKNKEITSKGLSIQAFNIGKKIKEVDDFLANPNNFELTESHPEICFKILNGNIIQTKKNTSKGQEERLDIINKYSPDLRQSVSKALSYYPKSKAQPDDIIDAAVLCLSAELSLAFNTLIWKNPKLNDIYNRKIYIEAGEHP